MVGNDGNGFVNCRCGRPHWGLHGAAGLLLERDGSLLLQLRAAWVHEGSTWSTPGGAIDSHETPVQAALREATEELAITDDQVEVLDAFVAIDHDDWRYHVIAGRLAADARPSAANGESDRVEWFAPDQITTLPLHPGFAQGWPETWARLQRVFFA